MKITGTEITIGTLWLAFVGCPIAVGAVALVVCMAAYFAAAVALGKLLKYRSGS